MAYRDTRLEHEIASCDPRPCDIRLGDAERHVILQARRDAQARRSGTRLGDRRLEALRLYAMLGRYRRDGAAPLLAAGFSTAERRIVDAMLEALPPRRVRPAPTAGRLLCAGLLLLPLAVAALTYGWADTYLQDRLVALVLGGLAALLLMPLAQRLATPPRRAAQPRK